MKTLNLNLLALFVCFSAVVSAQSNSNNQTIKVASLPYLSGNGSCGTDGFSTRFWQFVPVTSGQVTVQLNSVAPGIALHACSGDALHQSGVTLGEITVEPGSILTFSVENGKSYFVQAFSAIPFSYSGLTISAPSVIPATLAVQTAAHATPVLSFNAEPVADAIRMNWVASTAKEVLGYELQRSVGNGEFQTLAWMDAKPTSNEVQQFEFVDTTAVDGKSYFYRLKSVDADHQFAYSRITPALIRNKGVVVYDVYGANEDKGAYLRYLLSRPTEVTIEIQDQSGNIIRTYRQGLQTAGAYTVPFPGKPSDFREGKIQVDLWCDDEHFAISATDTE